MATPNFYPLLLSARIQKLCFFSAMALFLLILLLGSVPGARHDIAQYASGVVLHSAAYAVLALLVFLGGAGSGSRRAIRAVLTVAAMGAVDEYVQSFFPYRTAAVSDWLVDVAAGATVSAWIGRYWTRWGAPAVAD